MLKIVVANVRVGYIKTNSLPKKMNKYIPYIIVLVVGFVMGILCRPDHIREVTKKVTDTLVVVDTHIIEKPVPVKVTAEKISLVAVHDTIVVNDTVFVPIPIERKTYKGEDYFAEISGYKANLERIEVYPKTKVISKMETTTQTVTHSNRLRLGIEANYYSTAFMPIYLEYERMLHKNIGISARFLYDLPTGLYGVGAGVNIQIGW